MNGSFSHIGKLQIAPDRAGYRPGMLAAFMTEPALTCGASCSRPEPERFLAGAYCAGYQGYRGQVVPARDDDIAQ